MVVLFAPSLGQAQKVLLSPGYEQKGHGQKEGATRQDLNGSKPPGGEVGRIIIQGVV